ncbi:MAG: cobalt-precorrin-5B (C(1))-methyltransferase CbiD [Bacillota bacterium]
MNSYIVKNGQKLKKGYTTGSTATGAAKAAARALFTGNKSKEVEIDTPAGVRLNLAVEKYEVEQEGESVRAAVRKDGGDDPDITDGILIWARVKELSSVSQTEVSEEEKRIIICGGPGVGTVTRPGLQLDVGCAAVNPVPREMIKKEVGKVLPEGKKVQVTLTIPRGEELAPQTMNPDLGIKGGLSILGTTGIVEPMSHEAIKSSQALELKQVVAQEKVEQLVLVFGNYGQKKAAQLGFADQKTVKMSNYVGFMLDQCVQQGIKEVIIVGHIGKLIKVAGGIFNTHSNVADARMEIMAARAAAAGASRDLVVEILEATTTEAALQLLKKADLLEIFPVLAREVAHRAQKHVQDQLQVKTILYSMEEGILASYGLKGEVLLDE